MTVAASVRYRTASAMSFTVEGRPIGDRPSITSFGVSRCNGVATTPGDGSLRFADGEGLEHELLAVEVPDEPLVARAAPELEGGDWLAGQRIFFGAEAGCG